MKKKKLFVFYNLTIFSKHPEYQIFGTFFRKINSFFEIFFHKMMEYFLFFSVRKWQVTSKYMDLAEHLF